MLLLLAPFLASSLPGSPKYDGIRLFFPVFGPAALLAGLGVFWFCRWLQLKHGYQSYKLKLAAFIPLALALPITRATIDHYNTPTRFMAADEPAFPFEVTYWGNGLNRGVVQDLNEMLPQDARVKTLALQPVILELYQDWGLLRPDIQIDPPPHYDVHLVQNRRGFWGNAEWSIYLNRDPLATWGKGAGGEPLIFLYDGRPPGL